MRDYGLPAIPTASVRLSATGQCAAISRSRIWCPQATRTQRPPNSCRYRMVEGTLTEIDGEGVAHPVDSFDDEQMGSKWRVAEVDG